MTTDPDEIRSPRGVRAPAAHSPNTPPVPARRLPKDPRRPLVGLAGLLVFAFLAAFLSWYAAGPLWLSVGHGARGTAIVVDCPVGGMPRHCADFVAADRSFTARVALLGPRSTTTAAGTKVSARMVNEHASTAYAGDTASLYLRWVPSAILALLCGFGVAWISGTYRLPRRARTVAVLGSFLGPVLLLIGMLAFTY